MLRCRHLYRFGCMSTVVAEIEACLTSSADLRDRGLAGDEGLINRHCTWAFSWRTDTGFGSRRNRCTGAPFMLKMFEEGMMGSQAPAAVLSVQGSGDLLNVKTQKHEDVAETSACRQTLAQIGLSQSGADRTI